MKILDSLKDDSFSEDKFDKVEYNMSKEEKNLQTFSLPSILVLNKVDLVTNKAKLRSL